MEGHIKCQNILPKDKLLFLGYEAACEEGPGIFAHILTFFSLILIIVTLPLSLIWVVKVVQVN